jgi:uncharacterized protein (TIGR02145 family)
MKNFVRMAMLSAIAVMVVVTVGLMGCGDDNGTNNGGGNNVKPVDPNTVVKGSFTDDRDNQTYKTVKIGSQTWMAENLNYASENSWCYNDSSSYCNTYGRLYTWESAMTVCPSGWHLPDTTDWVRLMKAVGGRDSTVFCVSGSCLVYRIGVGAKLKATSGWEYQGITRNGTDEYGFSALPGGSTGSTGICYGVGGMIDWWASTVFINELCKPDGDCKSAYDMIVAFDDYAVTLSTDGRIGNRKYVRCVADN